MSFNVTNSTRLQWVDVAKGILIVMVAMVHLTSTAVGADWPQYIGHLCDALVD